MSAPSSPRARRSLRRRTTQEEDGGPGGGSSSATEAEERSTRSSNEDSRASSREDLLACRLCGDAGEDKLPQHFDDRTELVSHYSLAHFKDRLARLLPSAAPFKCPKCSRPPFRTKSALIEHYGDEHQMAVKLLEEELQKRIENSGKTNGDRRRRLRTSVDDATSSKTNSGAEMSEDSDGKEDADEDPDPQEGTDAGGGNDPLPKLSRGRLRCKLCRAVLPNRTKLKKHAVDKHFREEICKDLTRTKPFRCPFKSCDYESDTFQALFRHYGPAHNVIEQYMPQVEYSTSSSQSQNSSSRNRIATTAVEENGTNFSNEEDEADGQSSSAKKQSIDESMADSGDADSEESEEEEEGGGDHVQDGSGETKSRGRAGLKRSVDRADELAEFKRQVRENLRTLDGLQAEALDEKNIRCVCGKVVRLCTRFYWRYLVQKPSLKNGVIIQKGHWFTCPLVQERGSHIPQYIFPQEEIDASKAAYEQQLKSSADAAAGSGDDSDGEGVSGIGLKRRSKRNAKREELSGEPEEKRPREEPFNMERHVRELLATRVVGETFLQDGPCFQVSFILIEHRDQSTVFQSTLSFRCRSTSVPCATCAVPQVRWSAARCWPRDTSTRRAVTSAAAFTPSESCAIQRVATWQWLATWTPPRTLTNETWRSGALIQLVPLPTFHLKRSVYIQQSTDGNVI